MNRINVFIRRQRIKKLENWTIRAIAAEAFFLAIFPQIAAIAAVFGVVAWFLRLQIDTKFKMRSLPFDIPVTIFIMIGTVSVFMSSARTFELIYTYCGIIGLFGLTYLLVGQNIRNLEQAKVLVESLAASAVVVVLVGYFQYFFGVDTADIELPTLDAFYGVNQRIVSTMENPNILAGYLDVIICLVLGFLAKSETRNRRLILIAAIAALMACLVMTYSHAAFLTISIIFLIYGLCYDWRILLIFIAGTLILLYNNSTFLESILTIFTTANDTVEGLRIGIWASTISMIADHPFIGIGWGAYQFIYPQYNYYIIGNSQMIYHSYNLYLQVAAEIGIAGALAYFWYFFGTMFMALNLNADKLKNPDAEIARQTSESTFKKKFELEFAKTVTESKFLQTLAQSQAMFKLRLADLIHKVFEKSSTKKAPPPAKKSEPELVHHEEMKWDSKKKSDNNKKSDDDNIDIQKFAESEELFADNKPDTEKIFFGALKIGIGLAFLSMALNGINDDLLFNVPSSILMWLLGALAAAVEENLK